MLLYIQLRIQTPCTHRILKHIVYCKSEGMDIPHLFNAGDSFRSALPIPLAREVGNPLRHQLCFLSLEDKQNTQMKYTARGQQDTVPQARA